MWSRVNKRYLSVLSVLNYLFMWFIPIKAVPLLRWQCLFKSYTAWGPVRLKVPGSETNQIQPQKKRHLMCIFAYHDKNIRVNMRVLIKLSVSAVSFSLSLLCRVDVMLIRCYWWTLLIVKCVWWLISPPRWEIHCKVGQRK